MGDTTTIPARGVLREATALSERLGNENLGFLSETHGFMPREEPLPALPSSHAVWDAVAGRLPQLFRDLAVRDTLERMPLVGADDEGLSDRYLLRAATILGIFAHAYHYVQPEPPERIPASVQQPWEQVSRRLGRPAPNLSFIDLNIYNWRLIDRSDTLHVENLSLLVPIVGNEDERRFQMTPVEMLARGTPAVGAVVRAQEAVVADDCSALRRELASIADTLHELTYVSFPKVNPNRYHELYVNPVVWGKTVAPLATPYTEDVPGPSGTAIPFFQMLDALFGRPAYSTDIGRETRRARAWFPPQWIRFLDAVEAVSVPDYVERAGTRALRSCFLEALEAYAGDSGLLGRHRLKTYGYLDLSFKAGRTKTLGGFGGGFADRLWDSTDTELHRARRERYRAAPQAWSHVAVKHVRALRDDGDAWVGQVVLDVDGAGIRYPPGSRCSLLPEHGDELVDRTLEALRAAGDEPVELDPAWREAMAGRDGYQQARVLPLRTLLRFGRIRPVGRATAKLLHGITHDEQLRRITERRSEDQWELWALLDLLAGRGFNPRQLWKAHAGERASVCKVVPPDAARTYSISSVMEPGDADGARELHLTLARLRYETKATDVSVPSVQHGTASSFLARATGEAQDPVPVRIVRPPRFGLPEDPRRPVVMVAGGTGLAPFRALLLERSRQPDAGPSWLFFATRTRDDLYYEDELRGLVAQGKLHLRVAFSQEDVRLRTVARDGEATLVFEPGARQHIGEELARDDNARLIWDLLTGEGGRPGACLYVCGQAGFAKAVMEAVKGILVRFADGSWAVRRKRAREMLYRLVGEDRYLQEVYTTYPGPHLEDQTVVDASEVVVHNDDARGYWVIIRGRVYDLSEFVHMHPGGQQIIRSYAGMDATLAYEKVLHDVNPEVDSMLAMYELGVVRRLDFGSAWAVAISPDGLRLVTLKDVYRAWIGLLYTTVEIENAVANDYGIRDEAVTHDEVRGPARQSPYKTQLLLQAHERFVGEYLPELTGDRLDRLWAVTSCLEGERHDVRWMRAAVAEAREGANARVAAALGGDLAALLRTAAGAAGDGALQACVQRCRQIEDEDRRLLRELKLRLRAGVRVFERCERETADRGAGDLVAAAAGIPALLETYHTRLAAIGD